MTREQQIPLFLWVATAVLVHVGGYDGSERVIKYAEEGLSIRSFAYSVRGEVRGRIKPVEITLLDSSAPDVEPDPVDPIESTETAPSSEPAPVPVQEAEPKPKAKPEQAKEEKPKASEPEKKPEEKKAEPDPLKVEAPQVAPDLQALRRIAISQHVQDENQADNPNAAFLSDHANRVEEETQARITSTDQNDPNPTPGSHPQGPTDEPGNSEQDRVADSDEHAGDQNRSLASAKAATAEQSSRSPSPPPGSQETPRIARAGVRAEPGRAATPAQDAVPETLSQEGSGPGWVPRAREARPSDPGKLARKARLPELSTKSRSTDWLGLGATGTTPNGIRLNLDLSTALAAVGVDRLAQERQADSERRLSEHRGSWKTVGIERWRSAIENYVPSVKPGNTTALNSAAAPFATYLNTIHNRLHPIFADRFLSSLSALPSSHPLNNFAMQTSIEIVLSQEDGRIVRMGVTKASGVTAFDISALESVQRASPFGPPPQQIVSPDGNVYLHWEFHREPVYACSTYFAYPKMLKAAPGGAPSDIAPPEPPTDERERPRPDGETHGYYVPPAPPRADSTRTAQAQ